MRKTAIAVLSLCIFLGGCHASDPENRFETTQEMPEPTVILAPVQLADEQDYPYGNMQKNLPAGNFMRYGNDVVFRVDFPNGQGCLYTYDMKTGKVSTLLKDATYAGDMCGGIWCNLEAYQGELYGLLRKGDIFQTAKYTPDVPNQPFTPVISGAVKGFWHHGNKLYVKSEDGSLLVSDDETQELRMLVPEYAGHWEVVFDHYLYYAGFEYDIARLDLNDSSAREEILVSDAVGMIDGEHIYYTDNKTDHLYRCDMDGKNTKLLVDQPVLPACSNFDDTYFYFRLLKEHKVCGGEESYDLYRISKDHPEKVEKIATLPNVVYQVFTVPGYDRIFVTTTGADQGQEGVKYPIYTMGQDGSNITQLELPDF